MYGYIYKIENSTNSKVYIGQTTKKPNKRKNEHYSSLKRGKHQNAYLQHAFNKYGESYFNFHVLSWFNSKNELNEAEKYYIKKYDALNHKKGYNLREGGTNGKLSLESCMKLSNAKKGEKHHFYGKHLTTDHKKKLSEANKGKPHPWFKGKKLSEEHRKKISESLKGENNPWYGKHHSLETRKKISKNNGTKDLKVRKKISESLKGENNPNYGKPLLLETRKKMSESNRYSHDEKGLFGFTGANYFQRKGKPWNKVWRVRITHLNCRTSLGIFNDPLSCEIVYKIVREELSLI